MRGTKRVTVRRSAQEWQAIVSRYERSGQNRMQNSFQFQTIP